MGGGGGGEGGGQAGGLKEIGLDDLRMPCSPHSRPATSAGFLSSLSLSHWLVESGPLAH